MTHILQAQWTTSDLPLPDKSAGNYSKVEIHPKPSFVVQLCSPTKIGEFGKVKARYKILILKLFGHFTGSRDGSPRTNENKEELEPNENLTTGIVPSEDVPNRST